ncbi:MAG: transposase [Synergistaceae bacterium]|jgi:transposase|nr:transposase [Synergistaceae bacterium]
MIITQEQYSRIEAHLPLQRGNVEIDNITFINALLYAVENSCEWRALPERFGKWNSVYQRRGRWAKSGVLKRLYFGRSVHDMTNWILCFLLSLSLPSL